MKTLEELILAMFDGKPTHLAKHAGISNKKLYNLMRYNPNVVKTVCGSYVVVNKDALVIDMPNELKNQAN